jgi:hypothetical protein
VPNVDIEGESLPKRDDATDRVPAIADGIEATA